MSAIIGVVAALVLGGLGQHWLFVPVAGILAALGSLSEELGLRNLLMHSQGAILALMLMIGKQGLWWSFLLSIPYALGRAGSWAVASL